MEKTVLMNMINFPAEVWELHRKVFHRFLKYRRYFFKATKKLPEYKVTLDDNKTEPTPLPQPETVVTPEASHVINLLSTSEGEVSSGTGSSSDEEPPEEGENVGDV